jgi:hypothetical protein
MNCPDPNKTVRSDIQGPGIVVVKTVRILWIVIESGNRTCDPVDPVQSAGCNPEQAIFIFDDSLNNIACQAVRVVGIVFIVTECQAVRIKFADTIPICRDPDNTNTILIEAKLVV